MSDLEFDGPDDGGDGLGRDGGETGGATPAALQPSTTPDESDASPGVGREPSPDAAAAPASGDIATETKQDQVSLKPIGDCLACGAAAFGPFCVVCGQKNDDMRRSSLLLARDAMRDTFGFDSRMWRTLGLMAVSPGLVPSNYSNGMRSTYTPPVRMFLVISFLAFLMLGLTQTLFMAVDIIHVTPEEQASLTDDVRDRLEDVPIIVGDTLIGAAEEGETDPAAAPTEEAEAGLGPECNLKASLKFFVRPSDLQIDREEFQQCMAKIQSRATVSIEGADEASREKLEASEKLVEQAFQGMTTAVSNPQRFNASFNDWLPRVMFLMAPVLALMMGLFFRGKDALLFDHLVLALYTHAAGFVIVGLSLVAAQFGMPQAAPVALLAIALYFIVAVKRAYGRGWIKTVLSSGMLFFLYMIILFSIVMAIAIDTVLKSG